VAKKICKYKNCTTILSSYNKNKYCFIHSSFFFREKGLKELNPSLNKLKTLVRMGDQNEI
jgi:hypothetical protein